MLGPDMAMRNARLAQHLLGSLGSTTILLCTVAAMVCCKNMRVAAGHCKERTLAMAGQPELLEHRLACVRQAAAAWLMSVLGYTVWLPV